MKRFFLLTLFLGICGCSSHHADLRTSHQDDPIEPPKVSYSNGSIWQASSAGITEDHKARRRGDILTVVITETASASKSATTGTERKSSISAGIPNLLGLETNVTGIKNWMDLSNLINASTGSKFDGTGSTSRRENLNATITTRVIDVLPNGNLVIEGRRNVRVNNEDQIILLEGAVRPRDVTPENTINSSYVANARITYAGKGIISDRQQPGWLMGLFDKMWPF